MPAGGRNQGSMRPVLRKVPSSAGRKGVNLACKDHGPVKWEGGEGTAKNITLRVKNGGEGTVFLLRDYA